MNHHTPQTPIDANALAFLADAAVRRLGPDWIRHPVELVLASFAQAYGLTMANPEWMTIAVQRIGLDPDDLAAMIAESWAFQQALPITASDAP